MCLCRWTANLTLWLALGTLTLLLEGRSFLGSCNIIFLSLVVAKLPSTTCAHARRLLGWPGSHGYASGLLASSLWVTRLTVAFCNIQSEISARNLIYCFLGICFHIWKANKEITDPSKVKKGWLTRSSFLDAIIADYAAGLIFSLPIR